MLKPLIVHWQSDPPFHDVFFLASGVASFLSIIALPLRLWQLRGHSVKVKPNRMAIYKIVASGLYVLGQAVLVALVMGSTTLSSPTTASSVLLSLVVALGVGILSFQEHRLSVCPSTAIVVYLVVTSAVDAVYLAVPSHLSWSSGFYRAYCFQVVTKLTLLVLECQNKSSILRGEYHETPPEDLASFLSLTYFWWLHDLLLLGYSKILSTDDLPRIDTRLGSEKLRQQILLSWSEREARTSSTTLPRVLFKCFSVPLSLAILPRLGLVFFQFSQPLLISRTILFVERPASEQDADQDTANAGFWIVITAIVVYFGLTTSTAIYRHQLNRLEVMVKGALVGLIHQKALAGRSYAYDDDKALTLISTDVASVEDAATMLHELWGFSLESIVGFSMLAVEIGWLWPIPVGIVLFFTQTSRHAVKPMKGRQTAWNEATQQRLSMTSSIFKAIKSVKMLGIQVAAENMILRLRDQELKAANAVRWVNVAYNSSANALGLFSPVLTVAIFAVWTSARGGEFDTRTAFTTIAILSMITHPINMVMTYLPRAAASLSSFERIQAYLLRPDIGDDRALISRGDSAAVIFQDVVITDGQRSRPILQVTNLTIESGSVFIIAGPMGGGKSLLLYAILGEVPVEAGTVSVATKSISYCSQTAWLPNRTIRNCITGLDNSSILDQPYYDAVLKACCLHEDLGELSDGDDTVVGTNGQNLSGGQRQRVALARAVYSRDKIVVFDDSFSALDLKTQTTVIDNLLGSDGLLRRSKTTVLWASSNAFYFHLSDKIVLLANGIIQYQDVWEGLENSDDASLRQIYREAASADATKLIKYDQKAQAKSSLSKKDDKKASAAVMDYSRTDGDLSLYKYYFSSAGIRNVIGLMFTAMTYAFFFTIPPYYLKWWTESKATSTVTYAMGYVSLLLIAWIATSITKWIDIVLIAGRSGEIFHRRLLRSVCKAPLSFFSTTDLGTILNRFTQDIQLVDKQISQAMSYLIAQVCKLFMQIIVLLISQPLLGFFLPACMAIIYVVQKRYLRTSRQLRRIELESQSAVYFNVLETISGLVTIRAFGWQDAMSRENSVCLDNSQRPIYLMLCLQRWLNVVLDASVACVAVGTVWLAVAGSIAASSHSSQPAKAFIPSGGQVGVALNVILVTNTTLLRLVQSWTNLEVSLGAVARIREATNETPREECIRKEGRQASGEEGDDEEDEESGDELLPPSWPSAGQVELVNVTASYDQETPVLKSINLKIKPGEVAVICGRTGSGKSSLLLSLLRLLAIRSDGKISIDGVDLAKLALKDIRQRAFVTVSQDPFLLPGASLRFHLDPTESLPGTALAEALEKTGLLRIFASNSYDEGDGGDDASNSLWDRPLSSFPVLSAGQAQLLSLTRALLQLQTRSGANDFQRGRRMPVILLDEITASLDAETEASVYDVVEEVFIKGRDGAGHTVLIVTHRPAALTRRLRPGQAVTVWMANGKVERVEPAR